MGQIGCWLQMAKIKYFSSKGTGRHVEQPTSKGDTVLLVFCPLDQTGTHSEESDKQRKSGLNTSESAEPVTGFH